LLGQSGKVTSEKEFVLLFKTKTKSKCEDKRRNLSRMRELGLSLGSQLFLKDVNITKERGFGPFNLAGKWKKTYRGFQTKEPWYILANLGDLETAIMAYQ
jgi:hypothetical protein